MDIYFCECKQFDKSLVVYFCSRQTHRKNDTTSRRPAMYQMVYIMQRARWFDGVQKMMLGNIVKTSKHEDETDFCLTSRAKTVQQLQKTCMHWSCRCAKHVCTWHNHICRERHAPIWCAQLMYVRSPMELTIRRFFFGRPRTRKQHGFHSSRWFVAVTTKRNWCTRHNIPIDEA